MLVPQEKIVGTFGKLQELRLKAVLEDFAELGMEILPKHERRCSVFLRNERVAEGRRR